VSEFVSANFDGGARVEQDVRYLKLLTQFRDTIVTLKLNYPFAVWLQKMMLADGGHSGTPEYFVCSSKISDSGRSELERNVS
jgi:hypothetical protein